MNLRLKLGVLIFLIITVTNGFGQSLHRELTYYLPDIQYNPEIPSPESYFGHQVGEWHLSHDKLIAYMKLLADKSDRVSLTEYARTHEHRPLLYLSITSASNHNRLEEIRQTSLALTEVAKADDIRLEDQPVIIYQGYSVHGNESSGANAAPLVAYYLAAGLGEEVEALLRNAVILFDPCYNPDGLQRFSTWANSHKASSLISDSNTREYNEVWPGGRTNHYWFDLNRDWLLTTHPESKGRINVFHQWKPNVLTDHHEMGTNSTFFFQPGVPSRTNPNTPPLNQQLTEEIGTYHAEALDKIGSQYFTKAQYDDFYYGKGSTYPDIHGGIGILFEQASARGHYQESVNGIIDFPFTIRNQVATSLSTQKACLEMRQKLLEYKREFYQEQQAKAQSSRIKGIVINDADASKLDRFVEILNNHDIQVHYLSKDLSVDGKQFTKDQSFLIPVEQKQYGLIKTMFEKVTSFRDSIFYDVSAWTMPLAFDLNYAEIKKNINDYQGEVYDRQSKNSKINGPTSSKYGYIFDWEDFYSPTVLTQLLQKGINVKVITKDIVLSTGVGRKSFGAGSIFVPVQINLNKLEVLEELIPSLTNATSIPIYNVTSGGGVQGVSTGSPKVRSLEAIKPFMLVGDGVRAYDAGEVWYYMDKVLRMPITMIDMNDFRGNRLNKYNTLILPNGSYGGISKSAKSRLKNWIKEGGTVVAMSNGVEWLRKSEIVDLTVKKIDDDKKSHPMRNYTQVANNRGAKVLGGSIFKAQLEMSHPYSFGYKDSLLPTFRRGTTFYEDPENSFSIPLRYDDADPLMSGYIPRGIKDLAKGSPVATVHRVGKGRVACFSDNLLFRGYWWGTHKLMANALYFTQILDSRTLN